MTGRGKPYTEDPEQRRIRSFVLRQGRFTEAQQRAFDELWPRFGLDFTPPGPTDAPRDFSAVFGRSAPLVLEIGTGNGEALRYAAARDPARDHIGIEVHAPGVGRLLNALAEDGSSNARVYHHDAVEVLEHEIRDASLDEVRIYFPDPWHKKRHHKRRLIQPPFVRLLAERLAPGGYVHLATDWQPYAEQMLAVLGAEPLLANTAEGYAPRPTYRPETKFERRGLRLGHGVWDLVFRRSDRPAPPVAI